MKAAAPSASPDNRSRRQGARLISAALLAGAVGLAALAAPRALSGLYVAAHSDTVAGLAAPASSPITAARERALRAYALAVHWDRSPQILGNLGALRLAAAQRAGNLGDANGMETGFAEAMANHRDALALAPVLPFVWTRLTQLDLAVGKSPSEALRHLRMALETAPLEPGLLTARLGLAFAMWDSTDDGFRRELEPQIRYAAQYFPLALVRQARRYRAQNIVMEALHGDPDLLRRFSLAYSRS